MDFISMLFFIFMGVLLPLVFTDVLIWRAQRRATKRYRAN
jgi:hypothetical protein